MTSSPAPATPRVVDPATWEAALADLRVREKAATRELDAIAAARRRLPMVELPDYTLVGADGPVRLVDVFGDAPELSEGQIDELSPEHVVNLVRFLSSPASEGVNGQLFIVYGPTVTLVAAPTVEKRFTANSDAWAADDLDDTLRAYFADRDPERGFSASALMAAQD